MKPHAIAPSSQRGAALLTAMIIVTIVATLASAMVWQQWRAVQVESAERARQQAAWMLEGASELGLFALREDKSTYTSLDEPWAQVFEEARLSTLLAADKSNPGDGPEAFVSGHIEDAQARFNLTNLVTTIDNKLATNVVEFEAFKRLCDAVHVDVGVAQRIAEGLLNAQAAPAITAPLRPRTFAQLAWLGVDAQSLALLRPYVVLLPALAGIDVNTASIPVLAAVVNLEPAAAAQLAKRRPFKTLDAFTAQLPPTPAQRPLLVVRSDYFEIYGQLRLEDRVLAEQRLVQRLVNTLPITLRTERLPVVNTAAR